MSDAGPGGVRIAELATAEATHAAQALQQRVWGFEPMEVVPHHVLRTAQRHGVLLLGAWLSIFCSVSQPGATLVSAIASVGSAASLLSSNMGISPEEPNAFKVGMSNSGASSASFFGS